MSGQSDISLVIPTYNRADLIGETLESALRQSRAFDSVVVVDNGSTDDTAAVVGHFGDKIQYLRVENIGVQAARNLGVQKVQTRWLALCDSDDLLLPRYVQASCAAIEQGPIFDLLCCNFINFDQQQEWPDKFSQAPERWFQGAKRQGQVLHQVPDLFRRNLRFQPIFPTGLLIRSDFYRAIGGYDVAFRGVGAEDWEFALRAIDRGRVAFNTEALARIRRHSGNDSANGLRMLLGEAQILRHALNTMALAKACEPDCRSAIDHRLLLAFDASYAEGDFAQAREVLQQMYVRPVGLKAVVKRAVIRLPRIAREFAWRVTQGSEAVLKVPERVVVVEPAWTGAAHLPGNIGMVITALHAFPGREVVFVGDQSQIDHMRRELDAQTLGRVRFHAWDCRDDDLPGPSQLWAAWKRWKALPPTLTEGVGLIVLTSVTPTALRVLRLIGLAKRSVGMLHGNAVELSGWRSRHPVIRLLDLKGSLKAYVAGGGVPMVLEERIAKQLQANDPWLQGRVEVLPHPLPAREARALMEAVGQSITRPLRIGFAGMATRAKGFGEFLRLAAHLQKEAPGEFECHAIGMLHPSLRDEDQSNLATPAALPLDRPEFVQRLREMHLLFAWHHDTYYGAAASGVVYDAVNQLVPLMARRGAQVAEWQAAGLAPGFAFDSLDEVGDFLVGQGAAAVAARREAHIMALAQIRAQLEDAALGRRLAFIAAQQRTANDLGPAATGDDLVHRQTRRL